MSSPQDESQGNPESEEKRTFESKTFFLVSETQIAGCSGHCCNIASPTLFSNARDFIMHNPQFFTVLGDSHHFMSPSPSPSPTSTSQGQPQPERRCYYEDRDLELEEDIYKGKEYRLYRARVGCRAVVAKVFGGPRAEELCMKTADFSRKIMHPNVLQMFGDPWIDSGSSSSTSVLFKGDYQGTVEPQLSMALKKGIREGWVVGANTIIACSLGIDYLQGSGLPFTIMGPEHFVLMVSNQGRIVLGFDVEPTWSTVSINSANADQLAIDRSNRAREICNELIQKTFYASCKKFYKDQRSYEDDFQESDEDLSETDNIIDEPEDVTERQSLPESNPDAMRHRSTTWKSRQKPKANGHRRELVWNSRRTAMSSLEEIGRRYQVALVRSRSEVVLAHHRGRSVTQIAHSCPGYKRTEIILSPEIERSGIVSHNSPVPNEICSICGEKVGKERIFACSCGFPENIKENQGPKGPCIVSNGCPAFRANTIYKALSNFDHIYATEAGFAGQSGNQNQHRQAYLNRQISKADKSTRAFHSALVLTLRVVCSCLQPDTEFEEKFGPGNLHPSVPKLLESSCLPGVIRAFLNDTNVRHWIQHSDTYGAILDALRCMFDCGLRELMIQQGLCDLIKQLEKYCETLLVFANKVNYAPTVEKVNNLFDGISYLLLQQIIGGL